ncbi:MAG: DUF4347 domain-containing protein [Acidobacteria bacterium]|nr:DUF4347 domain-containing protein [Acidobacteriota bacterium]
MPTTGERDLRHLSPLPKLSLDILSSLAHNKRIQERYMINVRFGDVGPRVVLIQIALSTRPPQTFLRVDGSFGERTRQAVKNLQSTITRPQTGIVEGPEWQAMMRSMPFNTFDHADVDDMVTAIQAGTFLADLAAGRQYGAIAAGELARAGAPVVSQGVGSSNAVGDLVQRIIAGGRPIKIGLLRIFGHGGRGQQMLTAGRNVGGGAVDNASALSPLITLRFRNQLTQAASSFRPYGSVELHGCRVADGDMGRLLLRDLAEEWGVPVTAGIRQQHVGNGQTFRFEGPTVTAYPGRGNLRQWATRVAQLSSFSRA